MSDSLFDTAEILPLPLLAPAPTAENYSNVVKNVIHLTREEILLFVWVGSCNKRDSLQAVLKQELNIKEILGKRIALNIVFFDCLRS
jgi:hypothetical protein